MHSVHSNALAWLPKPRPLVTSKLKDRAKGHTQSAQAFRLWLNLRYTAKDDAARKFAKEMTDGGTAAAIRPKAGSPRCGFHIVEFFNSHHPDPNDPDAAEQINEQFQEGMFRFEKQMGSMDISGGGCFSAGVL